MPVHEAMRLVGHDQEAAQALADQTLLRGLTVEDGGINLDLIPPREIAALWVHCAIGMLGDAPNYTETEVKMPSVSLEISPAGMYDRYALIVQRVGKLTPHEARQQAEARAEQAETAIARVRELASKAQGSLGAGCTCSQCEDDASEPCDDFGRWIAWNLNPAAVLAVIAGEGS
ncbi:hypothetical protein ABT158_50235 [Nonomuraea sp. NPDC001636]|uniref:hypothetical protein n=1 Tax=Nonomuraea sp. NPDC001636 TaxID=3154391 RepID=UPI003325DDD9